MKKRLVFAYYSNKELDFHIVDNIHFSIMRSYKHKFDERIVCILTDDVDDVQYIEKIKEHIQNNVFDGVDVKFIVMKNESAKREGKAFKEIIYDHLDDLDGLTMFAHTKGKTSYKVMPDQSDLNIYKWIVYCWIGCIRWFDEDEQMIDNNGKWLSYGSVYMYDPRLSMMNHIRNNWCYSGSFQWLNCNKISKYIKYNNIDMSIYDEANTATCHIKQIAENFIGNVIPPSLAGFRCCERMNVNYPAIYEQPLGICYSDVDMVILRTVPTNTFYEYVNLFNDFKINIIDKISS